MHIMFMILVMCFLTLVYMRIFEMFIHILYACYVCIGFPYDVHSWQAWHALVQVSGDGSIDSNRSVNIDMPTLLYLDCPEDVRRDRYTPLYYIIYQKCGLCCV